MNMQPDIDAWPLACPICGSSLSREGPALACPARHSFDVAREGYVNLVPSQHRERGIEGDSPDMLRARRRFLDRGHYAPLRDHLVAQVAALAATREGRATGTGHVADRCTAEIGCGEGYYIGGLAREAARGAGPAARFVGMDVSKAAVRLAAKRYENVTFIVGNVRRQIYLHTGSVGMLLSVFAPRNAVEFARVTAAGGHLLIVLPSPAHLGSLRAELDLIGVEDAKEDRVLDQFGSRFTMVRRSELHYPLDLSPGAVADLVAMGPNRWHTSPGSERDPPGARTTEASFVILQFERDGTDGTSNQRIIS